MILISDKGQQKGKHTEKELYWENHGIEIIDAPLPCGDYIIANNKVMDVIFRKEKRGIPVKKMDFLGTYDVTVDTKKDIQELVGNVCGPQHARFRDELILAQNNGIKLYVLVANLDGVMNLSNLENWENPRLARYEKIKFMHDQGRWKSIKLPKGKPTSGTTLMKACRTMEKKYGAEFLFCHNSEQGAKVIELLQREVA